MKKKAMIISAVLVCILAAAAAFLSVDRAGGEVGFYATINRVENGIAYATVTEQYAVLSKKLPENIIFETDELGEELKAGDNIYGNYLSGTIDGQTVCVVSIVVLTENTP